MITPQEQQQIAQDDARRAKTIYRVTIWGGVVNVLLIIIKFLAGIFGRSSAMIADAVHSFSDFITDVIVLLFVKVSNKPADKDHAYGHGKYETLASTVVGCILLAVGLMLAYEDLSRHSGRDTALSRQGRTLGSVSQYRTQGINLSVHRSNRQKS